MQSCLKPRGAQEQPARPSSDFLVNDFQVPRQLQLVPYAWGLYENGVVSLVRAEVESGETWKM
eukprot:4900901-Amphidinium_carterae.1